MSDDPKEKEHKSWSRGLKRWLSTAPETRDELMSLVQDSRKFLEPDMVDMLEGVLDLPATQVREIMTPRTQIASLASDDDLDDILAVVTETAHSRYPVFDRHDGDAVIGILLTKDLIPLLIAKANGDTTPLNLTSLLRKPLYINETARSDTLLRSLQRTQVHMAVAVDEFGGVSGVVTMEDLLEEIVGDIVDEHDDLIEDSTINDIMPHPEKSGVWVVQASTLICDCNEKLGSAFDDTDVDTMGGLVMQAMGAVGHAQGQTVVIDGWRLTVVVADGRFIEVLEVEPT